MTLSWGVRGGVQRGWERKGVACEGERKGTCDPHDPHDSRGARNS